MKDTTDDCCGKGCCDTPCTSTPLEPTMVERKWAVVDHLSALIGFLGVPFGNVLGPLVIWWLKKDDLPFVNEQGKESLNFNLSVTLYGMGLGLLGFALLSLGGTGWFLGGLYAVLFLFWLVSIVVATVEAHYGHHFHYPLAIHFFK